MNIEKVLNENMFENLPFIELGVMILSSKLSVCWLVACSGI